MKKKIIFLALVLFLAAQSIVSVKAAPEEQLPINIRTMSAYCMDEELYIFCGLNENYDPASFEVNMVSEQAVSAELDKKLTPITESDAIVRYLFLIDRSGTMRRYSKEVSRFVETVMEQEKQPFFCTVAGFGERFDIVQADMTDKNAVKAVLAGLQYNERNTDPYTGVLSALTYLDGSAVRSGDLVNLVVITDGDPDLDAESRQKEQELVDKALKGIQNTPEVIVSTFCTAQWDETAGEVFAAGKGIHASVRGEQQATEAGNRMVSYVDSLYRVSFRLTNRPPTERFQTILRFKGKNLAGNTERFEESVGNIANLKQFSDSGRGEVTTPPETGDVGGEGEGGNTETPGTENGAQEPGTEGDAQGDDTEKGSQTPDTEDGTQEEGKGAFSGGTGGGSGETKTWVKEHLMFLLILVGGLVLCTILVIAICLIAARKKRGSGKRPVAAMAAAGGAGIPIKVEVYAGRCPKAGQVLLLNGELTIGSSPDCDLVFLEQTVSSRHSRVFMRDSVMYIEDLNSAEGTVLNRMRIQGQNRLRSGDVISIGSVEFCLKF